MTQISSFMGLQTTLRGLLAQQRALDVTSNNIGNAGTAGYTRQEAILTQFRPLQVAGAVAGGGGAFLGQGVEVQAYRRLRDDFLDVQFRGQQAQFGERDTTATALSRIDEALGEPGPSGLSALLDRYWNAWEDVANHPEDLAARQALLGHARALAQGFGDLDRRLAQIGQNATDELATYGGAQSPIPAWAKEIHRLNAAIAGAVAGGSQPNELLDRRDLLLDRLSELAQVRTEPAANGAVHVFFANAAVPLVDGDEPSEALAVQFTWPLPANAGGKLGALAALPAAVQSLRDDLYAVAQSLHDQVNALHSVGGGPNFFALGTDADGVLSLTVAITLPGDVRAGSDPPPAPTGQNDLAMAISALRNRQIDTDYANFVARVGGEAAAAQQARSTARALADSVAARRQSVTGVSMDEEMSNMVRFQRAYQASARAMSTVDEMLNTLINRTGRVGL